MFVCSFGPPTQHAPTQHPRNMRCSHLVAIGTAPSSFRADGFQLVRWSSGARGPRRTRLVRWSWGSRREGEGWAHLHLQHLFYKSAIFILGDDPSLDWQGDLHLICNNCYNEGCKTSPPLEKKRGLKSAGLAGMRGLRRVENIWRSVCV